MNKMPALIQELADCRDKSLVGGKAINLGNLIRAGFAVPGGFVVTTAAYRAARGRGISASLEAEIRGAYQRMGAGVVAVRSSATAEDLADASMAGQYETFLDIQGEAKLLEAIQDCWASLDSPRTRTYLSEHGIELAAVAMAVVVQRLVPADVAGVLFCANPRTGSRREVLIEASWGLGEAVVSGRVQPDVLRVDRETGRVVEAVVADKQIWIRAGSHDEQPVEEQRRKTACLKSADVVKLWELGRRAEGHFGSPQDIEWAIADGELFLLQSRPITTLAAAEAYEQLLQTTRQRLRALLEQGRGPWVTHNIGETLPHPTPLTWSVIRRFMSGSGGFGAMYRQVGFEPSPSVCAEGFLERIGGKAYMDLSAAADMFFEGFPFKYDLRVLRDNPDAGQSPPTVPSGSIRARVRVGRKVGRINAGLRELAKEFDKTFAGRVVPEFVKWCNEEKRRNLTRLPAGELIELWQRREKRVMDEFAPQSLLPSLIAAMAMAELRTFLDQNFWDDDPDELARYLSSGSRADNTVLGNSELRKVGLGQRELEAWLTEYGHRAAEEFDLATPRWREQADYVAGMAMRLKDGVDPMELHRLRARKTEAKLAELNGRLAAAERQELQSRLEVVRRYVPYREDGKYYLMMGYDLLRDVAMEVGRRLEIADDVFQLHLEELFDALRVGFAPLHLIAQRKVQFEAEKRVVLPQVIDKEALETLGEVPKVAPAGSHKAFAVSTGVATGPARVVRSVAEAGDLGKGYVLVCPSTDPGWTPLFVNAAALILECGGTLSHGAVIAREMNIPAVVLAGATGLFADGEVVCVDGRNGVVNREGTEAPRHEGTKGQTQDPEDARVARELVPPVAGQKDRWSARVRNVFAVIWGVYLVGVYALPEAWVYWPSMKVMDWLLWPMVRGVGKVCTVVIVAAGLAALTMLCQRWMTDNARLLEGKRRAKELMKRAAELPKGSKRRVAMLDLAAGSQMRVAMAALVPLAVLLGPLVMSCVWLPNRVAPEAWNAEPGTVMNVVATVRSDVRKPVTLEVGQPLQLDDPTKVSQVLPPIRETLEKLARQWQQSSDLSALPWELQEAAKRAGQASLAELRGYLVKNKIPPQAVSWMVRPKGVEGRFPVVVKVGDQVGARMWAVFGEQLSPERTELSGEAGIVSAKIVYTKPEKKRVFWTPLAWIGMGHWDLGWMMTYLVAYLPAVFVFRRVFKVA